MCVWPIAQKHQLQLHEYLLREFFLLPGYNYNDMNYSPANYLRNSFMDQGTKEQTIAHNFAHFLPLDALKIREVLHGVSADEVKVKFPMFAVNGSRLPLSSRTVREKRRNAIKKKEKAKKNEERVNPSDPIYTNPIRNLPQNWRFIREHAQHSLAQPVATPP